MAEHDIPFASSRGKTIVGSLILGSAVTSLMSTMVSIGLPTLGKQLEASSSQQTWVVNSYNLTLAALILVGGSLGDRNGRVRVYRLGLLVFAAATLACGVAWSVNSLIAFRLIQGIGGAMVVPGSLAIIEATIAPTDRSRAVGAWSGLGGIANAIGPLLGGILVALSWRWLFFINVPLAIGAAMFTNRIPESSDPAARHKPTDVIGAVLAVVALGGISYGLTDGPGSGWATIAVIATIVGVVAAIGLVLHERSTAAPMLPPSLFTSRLFDTANALTFTVYGGMGVMFFLLPIQLQVTAGWSAVAAGASMLPATAVMLLLSSQGGALADRIGPRIPIAIGTAIIAVSMALTAQIGSNATWYQVGIAITVFGVGLSAVVAPITTAALSSVPSAQAGTASGVNNAVSRTAGLLAVAAIPSLVGLSGNAFNDPKLLGAGFTTAIWISGAILAASSVAALVLIPAGPLAEPKRATVRHRCPTDARPSAATNSAD